MIETRHEIHQLMLQMNERQLQELLREAQWLVKNGESGRTEEKKHG